MNDHLSVPILNALADGELSAEQLIEANEHLATCPACTSSALYQSLLKAATTRAGARYALPAGLRARLTRTASDAHGQLEAPGSRNPGVSRAWAVSGAGLVGWVAAALLLLVSLSLMLVQRSTRRVEVASAEQAALITEVFDQHIATLAGNLQPQVLSSDRHTVKPWFQGKLPFSFNLPVGLPSDTTLDGANLTYLHNQPVAQLIYSVGRHRVSVFIRQKAQETTGGTAANDSTTEHAGFHVREGSRGDLEVVAVSDVDPARLAELVDAIREAQTQSQDENSDQRGSK